MIYGKKVNREQKRCWSWLAKDPLYLGTITFSAKYNNPDVSQLYVTDKPNKRRVAYKLSYVKNSHISIHLYKVPGEFYPYKYDFNIAIDEIRYLAEHGIRLTKIGEKRKVKYNKFIMASVVGVHKDNIRYWRDTIFANIVPGTSQTAPIVDVPDHGVFRTREIMQDSLDTRLNDITENMRFFAGHGISGRLRTSFTPQGEEMKPFEQKVLNRTETYEDGRLVGSMEVRTHPIFGQEWVGVFESTMGKRRGKTGDDIRDEPKTPKEMSDKLREMREDIEREKAEDDKKPKVPDYDEFVLQMDLFNTGEPVTVVLPCEPDEYVKQMEDPNSPLSKHKSVLANWIRTNLDKRKQRREDMVKKGIDIEEIDARQANMLRDAMVICSANIRPDCLKISADALDDAIVEKLKEQKFKLESAMMVRRGKPETKEEFAKPKPRDESSPKYGGDVEEQAARILKHLGKPCDKRCTSNDKGEVFSCATAMSIDDKAPKCEKPDIYVGHKPGTVVPLGSVKLGKVKHREVSTTDQDEVYQLAYETKLMIYLNLLYDMLTASGHYEMAKNVDKFRTDDLPKILK